MKSREKVINELQFQLNSKEVKDQHYPVQLSASDANAILALLKAKDTNVLTKWRKFEFREPDEEENANHPELCYIIENAPDDGEEILVSNGRYVWKDEFCDNGDECYLDTGHEMEGCWWMPLPKPPKEEP